MVPRSPRWSNLLGLVVAGAAIAAVTLGFRIVLGLHNPTIAALTYLLIVLVTATKTRLWTAVVASMLAVTWLNYFFMPPVGTFTIADPQNWVALVAFLAVSIVASNLSASVRDRAREALARRDEMARLFDLSRDVLLSTDSEQAIPQLATFVSRRFELDFVAICLPRQSDWNVFDAGTLRLPLDHLELTRAFAGAEQAVEFDAKARTYTGHRTTSVGERIVSLVPLRVGTKAVGLLAATGRQVEAGTLDTLAGVTAIAIERAQFLEDRKAAELARNSEELKSALLASLGHDLRTPLTAIRVAASNLQASWLAETDRREQSDLILAEVERLNRLFQNILEMARIDAGALAADLRWVNPSEIVEAARDQIEHALRRHRLIVDADADHLVQLDPRLTASALAHILENAAQYTPAGSLVDVQASVSAEALTICVRDHGAGISAADLPHLFDRFYRGQEARTRASGTGMGLSIARGMLAVERGQIWAENCPDGGARFTIVVPAHVRAAASSLP